MKSIRLMLITNAVLCLALLVTMSFGHATTNKKTDGEILFIYPVEKGFPFWDSQVDFAKATAKALNLDLKVAYPPENYRNRFNAADYIKQQIAASEDLPILVLTSFWLGSEEEILRYLNSIKVPLISINSDISQEQFEKLGKPRERFPYWLAQLSPNDTQVGEQLGQALLEKYRQRTCEGKACPVKVFGITGLSYSAVSKQRLNGLRQAVTNDKNSTLLATIYGDWDRERVKKITSPIINRHKDIDVFWLASDVMAYGLLEGIEALPDSSRPNAIIGSIDWSIQTIDKIKNDQIVISVGGHFLEGGLAIILFYDYINGVDFIDELGTSIKTQMSVLDTNNIASLGQFLMSPKWDDEYLKTHSKFLNNNRKRYTFAPLEVINGQINNQPNTKN